MLGGVPKKALLDFTKILDKKANFEGGVYKNVGTVNSAKRGQKIKGLLFPKGPIPADRKNVDFECFFSVFPKKPCKDFTGVFPRFYCQKGTFLAK